MSKAMIPPKFYAWDRNGKPLAFGKVYTYQSRTNAEKPTYKSEDSKVENTNPVILSGEGYADIYLSGSYKIVVKDSNDNEIWSADPVTEAESDVLSYMVTAYYVSSTSFKALGDHTGAIIKGGRVKFGFVGSSDKETTVLSSAYDGEFTVVLVGDALIRTDVTSASTSTGFGAISNFQVESKEQLEKQEDEFQSRFSLTQPVIEWQSALIVEDNLQLYSTGLVGESGYSVWLPDPNKTPFTASSTFAEDKALDRWKLAIVSTNDWTEEKIEESRKKSELEAAAIAVGAKHEEVIATTDTITVLDEVLYLFDLDEQITYAKPADVGAGEVVVSVDSGVLTTDADSYTLSNNGKRYTINTVSDIASLPSLIGARVEWLGYYAASDGGNNWGVIKSGSHTADGGSIFTISGNLHVEVNVKGTVSARKFGALESIDNTDIIQNLFDKADSPRIPKGFFPVSKTDNFASDFPDGSQPCIYIHDRDGMDIKSIGYLTCATHGQGILEIQRSKNINGKINMIGAGEFPPLDGVTGHGEKGTSLLGFDTSSIWQVYKNNSLDTSANTGGGYGGAFPKYGGGTSATWGMWNGGYIGNSGIGILIHNDCENITIEKSDISGFNFSGIATGFYGDYFPINRNYPDSRRIRYDGNNIHDVFDTGLSGMAVDRLTVSGANQCTDIGHPNSSWTDDNVNPGYGYASRGSDFSPAKNVSILGNHFLRCKRKGIDAHAGENTIICNNNVKSSYYQGIFYAWSATTQSAIGLVVSGNTVEDVFNDGIYVGGMEDATYSYDNVEIDAVINSNRVKNADRAGIYMRIGRDVAITSNVIKHNRAAGHPCYGMFIGNPIGGKLSYNISAQGNIVVAGTASNMKTAVRGHRLVESNISGNIIRNVNGNGMVVSDECSNNIISGNIARASETGECFTLNDSGAITFGNINLNGSARLSGSNINRSIADRIVLKCYFNGTASPAFDVLSGRDNVGSVVAGSSGLLITLAGLDAGTRILAKTESAGETLPTTLGGGTVAGYTHIGAISYASVNVVMKSDGTTSGTIIPADTLVTGTVVVTIEIL